MATITFNKSIEYFIDQESSRSYNVIPIVVVIIILVASLVMLILGAIGASYWKQKHKSSNQNRLTNQVIINCTIIIIINCTI